VLNIFYDDPAAENADSLLQHFKGKALRSPTRSTVPLLDLALNAPAQLASIAARCGSERDATFHFEHETVSGSGSSRPSQTDLMVLGKASALAVEAKWTEPTEMTVATRLLRRTDLRRQDESKQALELDQQHQEKEVSAWLKQLEPLAGRALNTTDMANNVYRVT
jgi:hypothetical protein